MQLMRLMTGQLTPLIAGMLGVFVVFVWTYRVATIFDERRGFRRLFLLASLSLQIFCGGILARIFATGEKSGFLIGAGFGLISLGAIRRAWNAGADFWEELVDRFLRPNPNILSDSEGEKINGGAGRRHSRQSPFLPLLAAIATLSLLAVAWLLLNRGGGTDTHQEFVRLGAIGSSEKQGVSLSPIFWIWAIVVLVLLFISVFSRNKLVKGVTLAATLGTLSFFPIKSVKLLDHIIDKIEPTIKFDPTIKWGGHDQEIAQSLATAMQPCVLSGFPDAQHRLPTNLVGLTQRPDGCFGTLTDRLKQDPVGFVLIVGRADRRALLPRAQRTYGSNLNLAYKRATSIKQAILDACNNPTGKATPPKTPPDLAARIVVLSAGAGDIESATGNADDRSVEIIPYWMALQVFPEKSKTN